LAVVYKNQSINGHINHFNCMGFDSLIFDRRRIGRRHTTILCKDINEIKFYQEKLHTYYPAGLPGQQPAVANCQRPQLCTACHINCQFVGHLGQAGIRTLPGWFLLSPQPTSSPVAPFVQFFATVPWTNY